MPLAVVWCSRTFSMIWMVFELVKLYLIYPILSHVVHPVVKEIWLIPFHCFCNRCLSFLQTTKLLAFLEFCNCREEGFYMNVFWNVWGLSILSSVQDFSSVSNLLQNLARSPLKIFLLSKLCDLLKGFERQVKKNEESERWSSRKVILFCKSLFLGVREHLRSKVQE